MLHDMPGVVDNPTQKQVLWATNGCRTELAANQIVRRVHYGEDGPGYTVEITREWFIRDQNIWSGGMQTWMYNELMEEVEL